MILIIMFLKEIVIYMLLFFGITFGICCRALMKSKGYQNYNLWFFAGFFLGIIGLIICLVMQDKSRQAPQNNYGQYPNQPYGQPYQQPYQPPILNENNAVTCPHCLELTPKESLFCIKCGCKLD